MTRILDGAIVALARRGHRKMSMTDICEEAGIARGTLYRYFNNKEEVLEAIGRHVEVGVREAVAKAIEERPHPQDRVRVVMEVLIDDPGNYPEARRVIDLESEFGLTFVRSVFPEFITIVREVLDPVMEHLPAIRSGAMTTEQLAELMLRIAVSAYFVPSDRNVDIAQLVAALPGFNPESKPVGFNNPDTCCDLQV